MANTNRTDVKIEGTKAAILYFKEKYESCHDGKYPNEEENPHIVDVFGADAELFIDKVGSKWVKQYEIYWDDETSYEFGLESAWYPPSDMLKEMHRQLVKLILILHLQLVIGMKHIVQLGCSKLQMRVNI
jgi:hypothetical protein